MESQSANQVLTANTLPDVNLRGMTAADSGSQTPKKANHAAAEIAKLKVMNRCRKRAAEEELPLQQIFDEVYRLSHSRRGGNDVAFATVSTLFGFPYMPFHAFSSPVVWCRVFSPAFSNPAFLTASSSRHGAIYTREVAQSRPLSIPYLWRISG